MKITNTGKQMNTEKLNFLIAKPKEFIIKNQERLERWSLRNPQLHNRTFRVSTIDRIFKKRAVRLHSNEIRRLIYEVLKDHPEGLTEKQVSYFSGISMWMVKKYLDFMANEVTDYNRKVFIRKIGYSRLYYAEKYTVKLIKQIEKTMEEYENLEKKLNE
jgi:hypothetical protein